MQEDKYSYAKYRLILLQIQICDQPIAILYSDVMLNYCYVLYLHKATVNFP